MAVEWKCTSLREAGVSLIDCDHRTPSAVDSGYPYIAIPQIKQGRIDLSNVRYISPTHFVEWTRKAKPRHHDVILSRRCNPGETAYVPAGLECALGQNLVLLRSDTTKVFPPFLRWLVRGPDWWEQVNTFINAGAVFDSLKCADIPNFKMPLPPFPEQKSIAHILGTLDDKIELNQRVNAMLDAMARTLFQSWLIDFDPVRAKAEGRTPFGLDTETAALFPDSFEDSDLGEIPAGWSATTLANIVTERTGKVGSGNRHVILSAVASGELKRSDEHFAKQVYSQDTSKYKRVEQWDYAYNPSRINIGSIGMLEEPIVGAVSPVYTVLHLAQGYEWFLRFFLDLPQTKAVINQFCSGSVRQSLSFKDFAAIPVVLPPKAVAEAFSRRWQELNTLRRQLDAQSRQLAGVRDTLLPKLMSGELRVPESLMA